MGHFASGVTVATTRVGSFDHAMTASAFTSVSVDPVMVLVCVDKEARFRDAVVESGTWAASILSTSGRRAADWFATKGRPLVGQLDRYPHHRGVTGAALLDGALAWLECRTAAVYDGGDHDIVLGAVLAATEGDRDAAPLLYHRSRYGRPPDPWDRFTGAAAGLPPRGGALVFGAVAGVLARRPGSAYVAAGSGVAKGTTVLGVAIGGQSTEQAKTTLQRELRTRRAPRSRSGCPRPPRPCSRRRRARRWTSTPPWPPRRPAAGTRCTWCPRWRVASRSSRSSPSTGPPCARRSTGLPRRPTAPRSRVR